MNTPIGYSLSFLSTLIVIAGDYYIKIAADRGAALTSGSVLAGCALYALSAIGWYFAMRQISLAQIAVGYSVFTLLALCALAVIVFGERLTPREMLGIAFAVAAIFLMARVA